MLNVQRMLWLLVKIFFCLVCVVRHIRDFFAIIGLVVVANSIAPHLPYLVAVLHDFLPEINIWGGLELLDQVLIILESLAL